MYFKGINVLLFHNDDDDDAASQPALALKKRNRAQKREVKNYEDHVGIK